MNELSPEQHRIVLAFAQAFLPLVGRIPGGDERSVATAMRFAADAASNGDRGVMQLFELLDRAALLSTGRRFHRLDAHRRDELLQRWQEQPLLGRAIFVASFLFKASHFDDASVYRSMNVVYEKGGPPEPARWLAQIMSGSDVDEELECDVVVVGSGAGGAVVGKELAEKGYAVIFLEEGELHRRDSFKGSSLDAKRRFYRGKAAISAMGNCVIPTFMGRLVGGSTAINTATCFRTPPWILEQWCERLESDELSPEAMARHFDRVEETLWVEPVKPEYMRGPAQVVERGCKALGYRHFPMRRNAPDCDSQGVCDFGCPSGARRSMDVSYIPSALNRGAVLFTGTRARRVLIENGRAVGVEAEAGGKTLRLRSRAVVLAGGAVPTPLFLLEQGICNESGQLGRNLSLHPACSVSARFDERIDGHTAIPQTHFCDEFHHDGILLVGASTPLSVAPLMVPFVGRPLMESMERIDQLASLGVMIEDHTRGRVRLGKRGQPLLTYFMTATEVDRLSRGLLHAAEIFFAAGAREVYPMLSRKLVLSRADGVEPLRRQRIRPWDFVLTSFHPLGTCRMGRDPKKSVVDFDHQSHEVKSLFVVDGSTVPGPPAVNPQITIMAMATRAAERIAERLG